MARKALVSFYSRSGNTKEMAKLIAEGIRSSGHDVVLKPISEVKVQDLPAYDGIVLGTPVYYGGMAADIKKLLDESVVVHGKLDGKAGSAFSSSANVAGGNETAITSILDAMLIHGMIVQGDPRGDHYGPVSIGKPDARAKKECKRFGERFGALLTRLG